jgi:hypothetical protein
MRSTAGGKRGNSGYRRIGRSNQTWHCSPKPGDEWSHADSVAVGGPDHGAEAATAEFGSSPPVSYFAQTLR